jgi:hypothetical protein
MNQTDHQYVPSHWIRSGYHYGFTVLISVTLLAASSHLLGEPATKQTGNAIVTAGNTRQLGRRTTPSFHGC